MPLSHLGQSRSARENLVLAFSLASVAGIVNSIGFVELSVFTSNMSGNSTRLGESLATNNTGLLVQCLVILGGFLSGAMTSTLLIERARLQQRARYVVALLLEAVILTGAALTLEFHSGRTTGLLRGLSASLAFSMGLQNALVTHISGAVVRTTHLTGIITDFGIEVVQLGFWLRQKMREYGLGQTRRALLSLREAPDFYKARLHITIFLSFLAGGTLGITLHSLIGRPAMAVPVLILIALVIYDQWLQNRWRRFLSSLAHNPWIEGRLPWSHSDTPTNGEPPGRTGT